MILDGGSAPVWVGDRHEAVGKPLDLSNAIVPASLDELERLAAQKTDLGRYYADIRSELELARDARPFWTNQDVHQFCSSMMGHLDSSIALGLIRSAAEIGRSMTIADQFTGSIENMREIKNDSQIRKLFRI